MVCAYQFYIHNYFYTEAPYVDSQKLQEFISNNKSLLEEKRLVLEKQDDVIDKNRVNELFDPNIESKEQLIHKGLSKRVVNNIINYRNKGGSFKV